jgi:hypothetical protein
MDETERQAPKIPAPTIPLADFYQQFDGIGEMVKSPDWPVYSHYYDFDKYELEIVRETDEQVEAYNPQRQVQEIIKCANSFSYFCSKYVKIAHPMQGLIPFFTFKYQRRVITSYEDHRFNILSKFRQGGLTTVSVLWSLWRCLFKTDQRIMIVSKTDREAIAAGEIAKTAMEYLPKWMQPKMGKCNEHERQFEDTGSYLWCYTVEAARGKSMTILVIDEAAFIKDMDKHWKAIYPVISTGGSCCVISTVNGVGNWYERKYHEAESGKGPFNIIEMDYWEHPEYNNPKWVKEQRSNLGEKGWAQEVLRSFLGSGETYIPNGVINDITQFTAKNYPLRTLFNQWQSRRKEGDEVPITDGALWIWKEPVEGHEYIIAADCAEGVGEEGDNSCFEIMDQATMEQVAEFYSNTVPPHIFARIIHQIGIYYNTALVVAENMNIGGAVVSALQHDLGYENLYYDPNGRQQTPGVKTGKNNRIAFLEALQNRLMNKAVRVNSSRLASEISTFMYNSYTKRPEARRGRHDDAIMAMALAIYIRDSQMRGIPVGAEVPPEMIQTFKSEVFDQIKKEILADGFDSFVEPSYEKATIPDEDGNLMTVAIASRRRDSLLKEFGW